MLGMTIKIKKMPWLTWFSFGVALLLSCNLFASQIVTKPYVYYEHWWDPANRATTLKGLVDIFNKPLPEKFAACMAHSTFSCSKFSYSYENKIPSNAIYTNGLPNEYYDVGRSVGTHYEKEDKDGEVRTGQIDVAGFAVNVVQECVSPFSSRSDSNGNFWCVDDIPESNSCKVGNPVDIFTGTKYEHEIDYSAADGQLKVERFYVNQNAGWIFDQPIRLHIINPRSEKKIRPFYHIHIFKFPKSFEEIDNDQGEYIYPRITLYNPESYRVIYMLQAGKVVRFNESNSVFTSPDLAAKNISLQFINRTNNSSEWLLILANNDKHYFDVSGNVLRTEYATGDFIYYKYDEKDRLEYKIDQSSRRISYAYDVNDRLISVAPPDGNVIAYEYTDRFAKHSYFLKKVSWANGESISYKYNEEGHMLDSRGGPTSPISITGKFDSFGQRIGSYKYYSGKAVLTEGFGAINRKQLDISPGYTKVTDANNSTKKYTYVYASDTPRKLTKVSQPAGSGCNASAANIEYFSGTTLKKLEKNFNGHRTQYDYDMNRQLETVRIEGIPSSKTTDYRPPNTTLVAGARKISTQWHPTQNKPVKVAEPNLITTYIYNGDRDPFNSNAIAQCAPTTQAMLCHKVQQATTDNNGASGLTAVLDASTSKREWIYTYNERNQLLTLARSLTAAPQEIREYYEYTTDSSRKGDLKKSPMLWVTPPSSLATMQTAAYCKCSI